MHQKVLKNKKAIRSKKNNVDENKKASLNGSNQVVTTDQSIQQPDNGKQAPKEKEKSGNANNEKQTKKKKIYILGDSMIKHLKGYGISAKLKQYLCTTFHRC